MWRRWPVGPRESKGYTSALRDDSGVPSREAGAGLPAGLRVPWNARTAGNYGRGGSLPARRPGTLPACVWGDLLWPGGCWSGRKAGAVPQQNRLAPGVEEPGWVASRARGTGCWFPTPVEVPMEQGGPGEKGAVPGDRLIWRHQPSGSIAARRGGSRTARSGYF